MPYQCSIHIVTAVGAAVARCTAPYRVQSAIWKGPESSPLWLCLKRGSLTFEMPTKVGRCALHGWPLNNKPTR